MTSSNRELRQQVFHRMEDAWKEQEDLLAASLNHLGGFRLNLYRQRGWDSVLKNLGYQPDVGSDTEYDVGK